MGLTTLSKGNKTTTILVLIQPGGRGLFLLAILVVSNGVIPLNIAMTHCLVYHVAFVVSTMPVRCTRRAPDHISCGNAPRLFSFVADPTSSGHYSQQLSSTMVVPVRPSTRQEIDIGDRDVFCTQERLNMNVTGEAVSRSNGLSRHCVFLSRPGNCAGRHLRFNCSLCVAHFVSSFRTTVVGLIVVYSDSF